MATTTKTSRSDSNVSGLTEEEKAAARETVKERKRQAKQGNNREAGLKDVLAKIAEMPDSDRVMAERIHSIVQQNAPDLMPRTWYGMPAYANQNGKIVLFFQSADKFKARYATIGFDEASNLDESNMWPVSWALLKLTPADEKKITELVKKAVS